MPSVATAPRGRDFISAQRRAEDGLLHFAFVHKHSPPQLCSVSLYHQRPVGASRLHPPLGPDAASPSSTFTPRCWSTSPPAPSTTSSCSRHPFPSTAIPPRAHQQPPLRPSPVPASVSTTPPRSTSTPISTPAPAASLDPHRRSPTLTAITISSQALMSPLPVRPPNRFPLGSSKDVGPTFPSSPSSAGKPLASLSPILAVGRKGRMGQTH
jgi:hypothetical protein